MWNSPTKVHSKAWRWFHVVMPSLLAVGMIVFESRAAMGAAETSEPLRRIWQALFGAVSDPAWENIHHYIRKTGHFTGYGTCSLLFLRSWYIGLSRRIPVRGKRLMRSIGAALVCTLLLASADEFHQSYLAGRGASVYDVLLDFSGGLLFQALILLFLAYYFRHRAPRLEEGLAA